MGEAGPCGALVSWAERIAGQAERDRAACGVRVRTGWARGEGLGRGCWAGFGFPIGFLFSFSFSISSLFSISNSNKV